ncbi:hypothetical protein EMIHUDRAFT_195614 [Emiliania huxleyi CCMP1516]|uniref:J domain-containing protein n=2 Tax=Emiliania huxleyi TaxID=2903 RepID=A0A0D3JHT1_EMIH1|nr:hypothetical protein EMIHUDRAFT_195614 [Emiliania huxleyi CCMP1516]EOD23066.1 hypothetical protein EMIHUDRAFT_195614 [Emiliania huxleyi CCMP1516]|eukprot:XP_005775495.1 hypothetical protein EMIHUDRAFT_195614 [Emiliania huxleyi CCMP1516]
MLARRTVVWRLAAAAGPRCRAHSSTRLSVDASLAVMGLSHGASPTAVKLRFYELAKLTHPDAVRDAPPTAGQPTFVEVLSAFEALVSLIKWCKEDKSSFEKIMNLVDEAERTPEEMEYMSYANFLYSGVDGYSK